MNNKSDTINQVDEKWFRAEIDKTALKKLSQKSDLKGLQHILIYFSFLFFFAFMSFYTWGTWWCLLWIWVYGVLFFSSNPIWHECGHRTAFKSRLLNEIFYQNTNKK